MEKEEEIKQLHIKLRAYNDAISFSESRLEDLRTKRRELMNQLKQPYKNSEADFSDVIITSYIDSNGILREPITPLSLKDMYEEYPSTQFLGYNDGRYVFSSISTLSTPESGPLVMLLFGKKKEKLLKHPHMKDIVAHSIVFPDLTVQTISSIDWEEWSEVQIISNDEQYGIVVKTTKKRGNPNQFSLFFCKKV